mmetsp:Transcript_18572/g.33269  ORF Transcript_18572/g.33269 Transcript_18572/m.33269 type:complete len:617 (-) Transcript_18572:263-2113(-)|eukprot:CAMPEP_0197516594 /NCGR_PEP_ID=MMETSP1318-20131121/1496_1 /TAXON_ID=552666 /ORGANISM="Partenskyella glossopodia, Strain RCC365" /LENGTH=616 /DNA_ID=CAMNT_0043065463 /DNA_START=214 /DNA_END=2064 /DNA_ORIENTATION=+
MALISEGMFEDLKEIAQNTAYMDAIKKPQVQTYMWDDAPRFEDCKGLEQHLSETGDINFKTIFHKATGFYMMKCFLIANYAVDKAVFMSDVEKFRKVRFPSARKKVAMAIWERFVNDDSTYSFPSGASVFDLIRTVELSHYRSSDSDKRRRKQSNNSMLSFGNMNAIGVYGESVNKVRQTVQSKEFTANMFDEVSEEVRRDLLLGIFPRFLKSKFFKRYIRCCAATRVSENPESTLPAAQVYLDDFQVFRALGRGGFGSVKACRKKNCGSLYAMKTINKKMVKVKNALKNVMEERNVLVLIQNSPFVTNLKYALQDDNNLYFIMDLMLGGDLKYHLINDHRFSQRRARFYAAQVLLGLEHIHSFNVIYRDLKLENVLLDHNGNCRLSDLGLAVVTEKPIKGYAGTPGYTAPEMIANVRYTNAVDIFSFGVMLYRMMCGSKPFKGSTDHDLDRAVMHKRPSFPTDYFTHDSASLLQGLLAKNPEKRLGCGGKCKDKSNKAIKQPIKDHPFFATIDWGLLEEGYLDPPFVPTIDVNAPSLREIGEFNLKKFKHYKLGAVYLKAFKQFDYVSEKALEDELCMVLKKADENENFEKFSNQKKSQNKKKYNGGSGPCCSVS